MAAPQRPESAHVDALLSDLLTEMRGMRGDLRSLGEKMAAHPEAADLRNALERLRVVEERETTLRERVVKAESRGDALAIEVQTLKTTGAATDVRIGFGGKIGWLLAGSGVSGILLLIVWAINKVAGN